MHSAKRLVVRLVWCAAMVALSSQCGSPTQPSPPPPAPALTITCPSSVEAQSPDGSPIPVSYEAPRVTGGVAPVTTACSVPSGSPFGVGATSVLCSATDARGTAAFCTFGVTVRAPPRLAVTRFVAFGDSITSGTLALTSTLLIATSPFDYPGVLRLRLQSRYPQQTSTVINEGEPGEVAAVGGVQRFRSVMLLHRPQAVLLMEGTNDLLSLSTGADRAIAALQTMVREAKSQEIRVALASIPPQRAGGVRNRDAVAALIPGFNERIRILAAAEGVVFVDVYAAMRNDLTLIGADDLHPTARGYEVIADTFFTAIRTNFEVTTGSPSRSR